jgi:hypothetical protein
MAMSQRELFLKFVRGQRTDTIPFFPDISEWYKAKRLPISVAHEVPTGSFIPDGAPFHANSFGMPREFETWTYLDFYRNFEWGLPVHIYDWCDFTYDRCEFIRRREGDRIILEFRTPIGTIQRIEGIAADGSLCPVKYFVSDENDWEVLFYVVKHSRPVPDYERIRQILDGIGELGVADIVIWRSPFGKIVTEYAGLERTVYQLADGPAIIKELLNLQTEIDLEVVRLAAESPAHIVILSDHADEQIINPLWYEKYCLPFYLQVGEILHANGKVLSTHLDGNFKGLFEVVRRSGFDLLDGCTPAPMTNYEVEELPMAMTPTMRAYCGVPSIFFMQDTNVREITRFADRIVTALAGRVVLNIGDILPASGDIHKAIELGRWVGELNRSRLTSGQGETSPGSGRQGADRG